MQEGRVLRKFMTRKGEVEILVPEKCSCENTEFYSIWLFFKCTVCGKLVEKTEEENEADRRRWSRGEEK